MTRVHCASMQDTGACRDRRARAQSPHDTHPFSQHLRHVRAGCCGRHPHALKGPAKALHTTARPRLGRAGGSPVAGGAYRWRAGAAAGRRGAWCQTAHTHPHSRSTAAGGGPTPLRACTRRRPWRRRGWRRGPRRPRGQQQEAEQRQGPCAPHSKVGEIVETQTGPNHPTPAPSPSTPTAHRCRGRRARRRVLSRLLLRRFCSARAATRTTHASCAGCGTPRCSISLRLLCSQVRAHLLTTTQPGQSAGGGGGGG